MTSSINSTRRTARIRRAAADRAEAAAETSAAGLPVPVDAPRTVSQVPEPPPGAAVFDAQLLGQAGEKRGLRAGRTAIDTAAASYNRTEWSGSKDRRGRKGGRARTEV